MENELNNNQIITTQTPKGYAFNTLLQEISQVVSLPDELIKSVFAVVLSTKLNMTPPLWLMLVGVPSSAKTDIVTLMRYLDFTYFIDSLTLNPFASGFKGVGKTHDLLPELDGKCFVCKDYTTIFSLNEETTKKLLGELVSIYDGEFAKFSPTRGYKAYKSSFSHIGCITPAALNRHQRYLNIIGARFLFYRIPMLNQERQTKGFNIAWNTNDRKQVIKDLSSKVLDFFTGLLAQKNTPFEITTEGIKQELEKLSLLMARSRGIVILQKDTFTNDEGKQITYYDVLDIQIEEPWRALQQLKNLAVCLALLEERQEVNQDDIAILKYIVTSSMPAERAEAMEYFLKLRDLTAKQLSEITGKSLRTCQRLLKELETLGIIVADGADGLTKIYNLHKDFAMMRSETPPEVPPEPLEASLPQKLVVDYHNDELLGVLQFITDTLKVSDYSQEQKDRYTTLAAEIEQEGIKRGVMKQQSLSISERIAIDDSLKSQGFRFNK